MEEYNFPHRQAMPALGYYPKETESTGTTLVAMECEGGVVVATDSRSSSGAFIASRVTNKITPINDYIVILRSGSMADSQAIADIVRYHAELNEVMEDETVTVRSVAHFSRKYHYNYREQLECTSIVAGYDNAKKGQVYSIPMGGYIKQHPYYVSGSGGTFIHQFVTERWEDQMDAKEARKLLKNAIFEAQKLDGASGGVIHTAVITKDGTAQETYRPDRKDFPVKKQEKTYPSFPEHIVQPGFTDA